MRRDPLETLIHIRTGQEPDPFRRRIRRATWTVGAVTAVVLLTLHAAGQRSVYQRGAIAGPHAAFADRCELCHLEPFAPVPQRACLRCHEGLLQNLDLVELFIGAERFHRFIEESRETFFKDAPWVDDLLAVTEDGRIDDAELRGPAPTIPGAEPDLRPRSDLAGPILAEALGRIPRETLAGWLDAPRPAEPDEGYHTHQPIDAPPPSCQSCHRQHGAAGEPAAPTDAHCTRCHADLAGAIERGAVFAHVRAADHGIVSFARGHPEASRHSGMKDAARIRLNHRRHVVVRGVRCSRCHVPRTDGASMRPIDYDRSCRDGCHELVVSAAVVRAEDSADLDPARDVISVDISGDHGTAGPGVPALLAHALDRALAGRESIERPTAAILSDLEAQLLRNEPPAIPLPKALDRPTACAICHPATTEADALLVPEPAILEDWLPNARFDHERHRTLTCTACHTAARDSEQTSDVLIPTILGDGGCARCHHEGGAHATCTTCHAYHDRHAERRRDFDGWVTPERLGDGAKTFGSAR